MGTPITIASGFYQDKIVAAGFTPVLPGETLLRGKIMPGIRFVKAGLVFEGAKALNHAVDEFYAIEADAILLACSEIPIALHSRIAQDMRLVDTTLALTSACIDSWIETQNRGDLCSPNNSTNL